MREIVLALVGIPLLSLIGLCCLAVLWPIAIPFGLLYMVAWRKARTPMAKC